MRPRADLAVPPAPAARWQVRLLGAIEAQGSAGLLQRFPSRAAAALLARLALAPERAHAREELVELLWPGVDLATGRNRLRQTLSTLKSLLEPAGSGAPAPVLVADRQSVRVAAGALACDAVAFEALARAGRHAEALALHGGDFMPGHYEDWVQAERQRLAVWLERAQAAQQLPHTPAPAPTAAAPPLAATLPAPAALPLPSYLTRRFGAEQAAAELQALVAQHRLVTLLGPGGSGKTRLAVEVAQALHRGGGFARVAFVPLVACESAAGLPEALARALALPPGSELPALVQALAGSAGAGPTLLVLDNFEQLVGEAENRVAELLAQLPALHLLVTSRRALGLDGEHVVQAQPLPLPAPEAPLEAAAANPAVALFVDRARAARSDFHLSPRNQAAVVALVHALHGMPLAIELAASRVRSVPPAEMAALLAAPGSGAHLALLSRSGPRAGHDARHASMAQVIAWSWRLLDEAAQRLLKALTLFPADASAAALAAVVGEPLAATTARLDGLVAHSLLRVHEAESAEAPADPHAGTRFSLLEPVREYASAERSAEDTATLAARQRQWLLAWARSPGLATTPARVATELAAVHATLADAASGPATAATALQLALALRAYWDSDALPGRIVAALEAALQAVPAEQAALRADAHELLAYLRFEAGFGAAAQAHAQAAVAAAGSDPARRARALVRAAWVQLAAGRVAHDAGTAECEAWLQEALQLARACGDREVQARALHQQAVVATHARADWAGGERLLAESQALWLALGDRRKASARLRNRAQCWLQLGRPDDARACYDECERAAREDGDWVGRIDTLISLGSLLTQQRRWQEALDAHRRCVALCWQRWHRHGLAYALWNPPRLLARLHRPEPAMRLMGFAVRLWTENFGPLSRADEADLRRVRRLVRAQLGAARMHALEAEGAALDLASAARLALQG